MHPEQLVTSTGWRVVGKATALIDGSRAHDSLSPGRDEDVLFSARLQLRPRMGRGTVRRTVLATLHNAIARDWQDAPPLTADAPLNRPPARFHGLAWRTTGDDDAWTGELVWRHTHPIVAGAPCTTHVIVTEQTGHASLQIGSREQIELH
jgi:hypothetical protein